MALQAYKNQAKIRYNKFLSRTGHKFCFFKISINGEVAHDQVVFELFTDICPRTCENFRRLCLGDAADGRGPDGERVKMSYKNTRFFRIVKDGWIQGGDIVYDRGSGGCSIYGEVCPYTRLLHTAPRVLHVPPCALHMQVMVRGSTTGYDLWPS